MSERARTRRAPASVERALAAPSHPLDGPARSTFERRHGGSLDHVRVREDAASTRDLHADAYTVGGEIVFAPGRYKPGTRRGDALLGHELAHVIQQRHATAGTAPLHVVPAEHATEREAAAGEPRTRLSCRAVQRAPAGTTEPARAQRPHGTGGAFTAAVLGSPLGIEQLLLEEFTTGVVAELQEEETRSGAVSQLLDRYRKMGLLDRLEYAAGLNVGFFEGVVSPVVDVVKLVVSLVQFAEQAQRWLIAKAIGLVTGSLAAELRERALRVGTSLVRLSVRVHALLEDARRHPRETLRMLGSLADTALERLFANTRALGRDAAKKALEFFRLPWYELGTKIGYAAGFAAIQIALLFFSDGVSAALTSIAKFVAGLGEVGAGLVRVVRLAVAAIGEAAAAVRRAVGWLAGELRAMATELGAALDELGALFEEILGRAPRLEGEGAGAAERAAGRPKITLMHGTQEIGPEGLDALGEGRIDVAHTGGAHQDLGRGFYLTTDRETAAAYARPRGSVPGGMQHVLSFDVPVEDLGTVVDIRPGGNFRAAWEQFLDTPDRLGITPRYLYGQPGFSDVRGAAFEDFLRSIGRQDADTILAPLGDDVFVGVGAGYETTQVCIRSQRVADRLNAIVRGGR